MLFRFIYWNQVSFIIHFIFHCSIHSCILCLFILQFHSILFIRFHCIFIEWKNCSVKNITVILSIVSKYKKEFSFVVVVFKFNVVRVLGPVCACTTVSACVIFYRSQKSKLMKNTRHVRERTLLSLSCSRLSIQKRKISNTKRKSISYHSNISPVSGLFSSVFGISFMLLYIFI